MVQIIMAKLKGGLVSSIKTTLDVLAYGAATKRNHDGWLTAVGDMAQPKFRRHIGDHTLTHRKRINDMTEWILLVCWITNTEFHCDELVLKNDYVECIKASNEIIKGDRSAMVWCKPKDN
jgi:hypothetical protein